VFGGVEWESGRTFLVPVPDRTADTLTALIRAWIERCTTVISDCWGAYRDLDSLGYTHRNSSILTPATTQTPSSPRGVASGSSSGSTTGQKTTTTTKHTTCLRRGARHRAFHHSYNSFISSQTPTDICAMFHAPLPRPRDALAVASPTSGTEYSSSLC
jgi:hypothetical protein